ncbi:accessory gene regulator B family protein [uncultured Eubacterium sp.]|uniref:accessory gene regulator ArgB-like protein n=1 Tax=uncultured Eubacterium sp. TaxID=165185 RepID=UPI0025D1C90E|nr:accessory gene regulator B family protein [uncultured Eubacterium sp.]
MINKISSIIVEILIKHSLVENEDKELYLYGFFILLSQILYFIIVITIGILFNVIFESIIFYITFQFIRRYAGGYHAKTETRCDILSTLSILCCIVLIKLSKMYDIRIALLSASLVFAVLIFILCPLDTPEKPLNDKEYKYFRKISWIILSLIIIAIIVSFYFKFNIVFAPCCASLILEGVLIGTGQIKKAYSKKRANSKM